MKPFHPILGSTISVNATTTSASAALARTPNVGEFQVRLHNAGTDLVFVEFGASSVAAATTSYPLPGGALEVITLLNTADHPITNVAAVTATGTATVYVTAGWGI